MPFLTTDNPRLLKLLESYRTSSPNTFIDSCLVPYVSIEHAEEYFLNYLDITSGLGLPKGAFSYAYNDKTLMRDLQFWIGIYRLLGFSLSHVQKRNDYRRHGYTPIGGLEIVMNQSGDNPKVWRINYDNNANTLVIITDFYKTESLESIKNYLNMGKRAILTTAGQCDYQEYQIKEAISFSKNVVIKMLNRLREISSQDEYNDFGKQIVLFCA